MKKILTSLILLLAVSLQAQSITVDGNSLLVSENNSFPLWLASGSTIRPNPPVHLLSVVEYAELSNGQEMNLMYSGVLNITQNSTVPEGKVWKVVSAMEMYELSCIDEIAYNYDLEANIADSNCYEVITGCTDASSYNYITPTGDVLVDVNTDDGSCIAVVFGCTDANAFNYDVTANTDDDSCIDVVLGCLDATACNYSELANTDDNLCEYATEGNDCEGNELSVAYEIGDQVEGGIVFYIDQTGEHGLVAAMEDLEGTYDWGCYGSSISGAFGTVISTGYQNTLDIVADCSDTNTAAFNALNSTTEGYTDWYLPSKNELVSMYNTIGNGGPEGNIGVFENTWYWSSSEYSSNAAWLVYFDDGYTSASGKLSTYRVRIIRAF